MTHLSEDEFTGVVHRWWIERVGEANVHREVYQPDPYWFVDLVVERPEVTWYIEVENDAGSIRHGVGQALGYAADHPAGEPMVIVPADHTHRPDVDRLRESQAVLIREFDAEERAFVR